MVDIVITPASVIKGATSSVQHGTAGATITAGEAVYLDSATGTFKLANCGAAATAGAYGIALNGADTGQPLAVHRAGAITIGGTLTAGTAYYLSATDGGICPFADLVATDAVVQLGLASSTTVLEVQIQNPGVTL